MCNYTSFTSFLGYKNEISHLFCICFYHEITMRVLKVDEKLFKCKLNFKFNSVMKFSCFEMTRSFIILVLKKNRNETFKIFLWIEFRRDGLLNIEMYCLFWSAKVVSCYVALRVTVCDLHVHVCVRLCAIRVRHCVNPFQNGTEAKIFLARNMTHMHTTYDWINLHVYSRTIKIAQSI